MSMQIQEGKLEKTLLGIWENEGGRISVNATKLTEKSRLSNSKLKKNRQSRSTEEITGLNPELERNIYTGLPG